jgi:hypothetical protein
VSRLQTSIWSKFQVQLNVSFAYDVQDVELIPKPNYIKMKGSTNRKVFTMSASCIEHKQMKNEASKNKGHRYRRPSLLGLRDVLLKHWAPCGEYLYTE